MPSSQRSLPFAAVLVVSLGCGTAGPLAVEPQPFTPFEVVATQPDGGSLSLAAAPTFGDERGGAVAIGAAGEVVRLRLDGTVSRLEGHPSNPVAPGTASAAFRFGPFTALVPTTTGLYLSESGWLLAPPWREALRPEGLKATAIDDGVAWLAHEDGLYRITQGQLSELTVEGQKVAGLNALAIAPGPSGAQAVWLAQGESVSAAELVSKTQVSVVNAGLPREQLKGGVAGLAGLSPSAAGPGEVWVATEKRLWRHKARLFQEVIPPGAVKALHGAGRVLWLETDSGLYRYDADAETWGFAQGSEGAQLLGVDPAGAAWVRLGERTVSWSPGAAPRVQGLFEAERLYSPEAPIQALVPAALKPTTLHFSLDGVMVGTSDVGHAMAAQGGSLAFAPTGFEPSGAPKPLSVAVLENGWHALVVKADLEGGGSVTRTVHFELKGGDSTPLGYAADIAPIHQARCAKCHVTGPGRDLATYERWKEDAQLILAAVKDQRMPADGPLDPSQVQKIQRWASSGAAP